MSTPRSCLPVWQWWVSDCLVASVTLLGGEHPLWVLTIDHRSLGCLDPWLGRVPALARVLGSTRDTMTYACLSIPYLASMFALLYGRAVGVGRVHHAVSVWLHLDSR